MSSARHVPEHLTFDRAPRRVYWEITRACSLACRHCRAEASPGADPEELTPAEGRALLARLAEFDPKPHVVLTGGDPLERADLFSLIATAQSFGLEVSVSPSATPLLTADVIREFARARVAAISLSLDGATAEKHDALRGVPGTFARTMEAARAAADAGLMVQINTLVCAETVDDVPAILELARELRVARFCLFFLVSVGRGEVLQPIDAPRADRLLEWFATAGGPPGSGPILTTTEAPHFRRVLLEKKRLPMTAAARAAFGVRDGNGVMFISHRGEMSPSGFLPLVAGNVRSDDVLDIYRGDLLFRSLRRAEDFGGRCGACNYNAICGGSRARAWSATGDPLAEDPLCTYDARTARI